MSAAEQFAAVKVGDRIRFTPARSTGKRWWTVRARDERYLVATCKAPFTSDGLFYTVVDLTGWQDKHYNGQGMGVVRSSLNTLGGGCECSTDEQCQEILADLYEGWELSHRRILDVTSIEVS